MYEFFGEQDSENGDTRRKSLQITNQEWDRELALWDCEDRLDGSGFQGGGGGVMKLHWGPSSITNSSNVYKQTLVKFTFNL